LIFFGRLDGDAIYFQAQSMREICAALRLEYVHVFLEK